MPIHPRVTPQALALVQRFEGLRLTAVALPQGGYVIGHGHVSAADPGRAISPAEALALLRYDLSRLAEAIEPLLLAPATAAQFDAFLSFAHGVGVEGFARSVVLQRFNAGAYLDAAAALELWRCAQIEGEARVVDVLVRRRAVEKAHFLEPPQGFTPAPSALLRPVADADLLAVAAALDADAARAAAVDLGGADGVARWRAPAHGEAEEPAPSAALAVVAALSARLDRLLPDEEPEPPPIAVAPANDHAPPVEVEPEPAPASDPKIEPEIEPALAPEPEPEPQPESAPPSARPDLVVVAPSVSRFAVWRAALRERFGERGPERGRSLQRVSPPSMRTPGLILGLFGLVLFALAVLKTYQAPSLKWLGVGLLAVVLMAPASLILIGPRRREDE